MTRQTSSIISAMNDRLLSFASGAYEGNIVFENDTLNPSSSIWLEQFCVFAAPEVIGAFDSAYQYREQGFYQINVCKKMGGGILDISRVCDSLCDWFYRGLVLTSGSLRVKVERSSRGPSVRPESNVKIPVSVYFMAYDT